LNVIKQFWIYTQGNTSIFIIQIHKKPPLSFGDIITTYFKKVNTLSSIVRQNIIFFLRLIRGSAKTSVIPLAAKPPPSGANARLTDNKHQCITMYTKVLQCIPKYYNVYIFLPFCNQEGRAISLRTLRARQYILLHAVKGQAVVFLQAKISTGKSAPLTATSQKEVTMISY
jgi:hypothetical protein